MIVTVFSQPAKDVEKGCSPSHSSPQVRADAAPQSEEVWESSRTLALEATTHVAPTRLGLLHISNRRSGALFLFHAGPRGCCEESGVACGAVNSNSAPRQQEAEGEQPTWRAASR